MLNSQILTATTIFPTGKSHSLKAKIIAFILCKPKATIIRTYKFKNEVEL
ncbi:MAG: hypothetical protein IKC71_05175 [Clostridia bacterium]|nr:hypothetical protein [Clostridia bacterium]